MSNLKDVIFKICSNYKNDRSTYNHDHPQVIRDKYTAYFKDFVEILRKDIDSTQFNVRFILGIGNMTYNPVVYIKSKEYLSQSALDGFYVALIFNSEMSSFYLSMNQGATTASKGDYEKLTNIICRIIEPPNLFSKEIMELGETSKITIKYTYPHMFGYKYSTNSFETSEFQSHLLAMMEYYSALINHLISHKVNIDRFEDVYRHFANYQPITPNADKAFEERVGFTINARTSILKETTSPIFLSHERDACSAKSDKLPSKDYIGINNLTDSLSLLFANPETEVPLTTGIFGDWGYGKSTIIKFIESNLSSINRELKEEINRRKLLRRNWFRKTIYNCCFPSMPMLGLEDLEKEYTAELSIRFLRTSMLKINASMYGDSENLWSMVYLELLKLYKNECGKFKYWRYYVKKFLSPIFGNTPLYGALIFSVVIMVHIMISFSIGENNLLDKITSLATSPNIVDLLLNAGIPTFLIVIAIWIYNAIKMVPRIGIFLNESNPNKLHISRTTYKTLVLEDIRELVGKLTQDQNVNKKYLTESECQAGIGSSRLVIVIDELDRCNNNKIQESFESIQLLLDIDNLITIISMNYDLARHVIGHNHQFLTDTNNELFRKNIGHKYIEKYVTLPIFIDSMRMDNYFDHVFDVADEELTDTGEISSGNAKDEKILNNSFSDNLYEKNATTTETATSFNKEEEATRKKDEESKFIGTFFKYLRNYSNSKMYTLKVPLDINPRNTKRIYNILRLSKTLITLESKLSFEAFNLYFLLHYFGINLIDPIKWLENNIKDGKADSEKLEIVIFLKDYFASSNASNLNDYLENYKKIWSYFIHSHPSLILFDSEESKNIVCPNGPRCLHLAAKKAVAKKIARP